MQPVVVKAQRLGLVLRTYPIILIGAMLGGVIMYGIFPLTNLLQFLIEGLIAGALVLFFPIKNLTIHIDETTLKAPLGRSFCLKSITVDLSEVLISENFIDWFRGSQITTKDGQIIRISSLFYGSEQKKRILEEIKSRKGE